MTSTYTAFQVWDNKYKCFVKAPFSMKHLEFKTEAAAQAEVDRRKSWPESQGRFEARSVTITITRRAPEGARVGR